MTAGIFRDNDLFRRIRRGPIFDAPSVATCDKTPPIRNIATALSMRKQY
nr:hypothetical protein [Rhizobium sp. ACO-34A]